MACTVHVVVPLLLLSSVATLIVSDYPAKGIAAKIVGGSNAETGQFPFIGSLRYEDGYEHGCGVSLIDKDKAVTAAHCLEPYDKDNDPLVLAVFGDVQLSLHTFHHESTFSATVHPLYDKATLENDIALIHLDKPVKHYNRNIRRISLSKSSRETSIYLECFVIGWGVTGANGSVPDNLQYVETSIYQDVEECEAFNNTFLQSTMLCAGNEGADACVGDSGGPLACRREDSKEYELAGIVSYGHEVCEIGYPSVYTRVSAFLDFTGIGSDSHAVPPLQMSIAFVMCMVSFAIGVQ